MIAASPFGDIVKQRGDKDQFRMRQARPQLHAQRMLLACLFTGEAFQLLHNPNSVLIHRIGMEQVELHLADNVRPLRHIGAEHAVSVHRQEAAANRAGMTQHR